MSKTPYSAIKICILGWDIQARWRNDLKFIELSRRKTDTGPQKKKAAYL